MTALLEIAGVFLRLGCLAFGGPIAHLGYFRREFVERRGWIADDRYAELVALCQFLPGPASSQVAFGIGHARAGAAGGLTASVAFLLPSAALMIAAGAGLARAGDISRAGWLHGLLITTVAVVAQALWSMSRTLWRDGWRRAIGVAAAAMLIWRPSALATWIAIAAGAITGRLLFRKDAPLPGPAASEPRSRAGALAALFAYGALLTIALLSSSASPTAVTLFLRFYRAGALVFGGGHVVLPLLRAAVVPPGWISDDLFLAGYGAAQALPGPLFTFAGYLGAAIAGAGPASVRGAWTVLAIFLPGWLLIGGVLPVWRDLRTTTWAPALLAGANAAVVGVLLAAWYDPIVTTAIHAPIDALIAAIAFIALVVWRAPTWAIVAGTVSIAMIAH